MADYQFEFRGLQMGLGTDYHIVGIEGLEDDDVRVGDVQIPRAGGDIAGLHVAAGRHVIMDVIVRGVKDSQDLRDKVQALVDAFQHSDTTDQLIFQEPGMVQRYVNARSVGRAAARDPRSPFMPMHKLRLKLADPRAYAVIADQDILPVYSASSGGLDYAITEYGKDYAVDPSSEVVMSNDGNAKAWPLIRFYGPLVGTVTQITLTNTTTGKDLVLDTTMLTGEVLTVDMHSIVTVPPSEAHVIRLGATNKYTDWAQPREPFYLAPGSNTLRFEVTGGSSTDASCVVTFNDTWL